MTQSLYERAVAAIDSVSWRGIMPGLERTEGLLAVLGNPQQGLRGALVAGTNGKGSVCAVVDSVCRAAGLRTILLTKPHLISYCERFVRDGTAISETEFGELMSEVAEAATQLPEELQPTGFEMLTAAGILLASRAHPDLIVCEVGLGGRLDSTNVLDLDVNVITNVDLDHQEYLGPTVSAIAAEKARIIKPGSVAVTAATPPALDVIERFASSIDVEVTRVHSAGRAAGLDGVDVSARFEGETLQVRAPLLGAFQIGNVATALAVCDALRSRGFGISAQDCVAGCESVRWPARMQWIDGSPAMLIDGAHNPAGMTALSRAVADLAPRRNRVAVFAAMHNKDVRAMTRVLAEVTQDVVVTEPASERAASPAELAALFDPVATVADHPQQAIDIARERAGTDGLVLVCGSLYLAGEVLQLLGGEHGL